MIWTDEIQPVSLCMDQITEVARWYEAVVETPVTGFRNETDAFLDTIEQHFEMALEFLATMATGLIARRAEMRKETEPAVVA